MWEEKELGCITGVGTNESSRCHGEGPVMHDNKHMTPEDGSHSPHTNLLKFESSYSNFLEPMIIRT